VLALMLVLMLLVLALQLVRAWLLLPAPAGARGGTSCCGRPGSRGARI
jgi:hypothetical protein